MTRTRRFFGGLRLSYLHQALVTVVGLWLTPFLLEHLGQHQYGVWLVGLQTLSYLILMDFGIVALLPRETAYVTGHTIAGRAGPDMAHLIGRTAQIVLCQTPLVAAGGAAIYFFVPMGNAIRGPILVALAGFTLLFPLRIFQAILHGLQETPYLGKLQLVGWAVTTVLMVALVLAGLGMYALAIGWVVGQLLPAACSFYHLKRKFAEFLPSRLPKITRAEVLQGLTSGTWVSVAKIAQMLVAGSDYLIIGKLLGPDAVVPYACTQKLISVLGTQSHMIMEMAQPGLSQMKTSENRDNIFRVCSALTLSMLIASGAVVCVYLAVNHSFVSWWIGERQFGGTLLTVAMGACLLIRQWNMTSVYSVFALGHERRLSLTALADGIVTVGASWTLLHWFGPLGAALGSIVGVCLVTLPGNLLALAHELEVPIFKVIASIGPWFRRFLPVAALAVVVGLPSHASLPYLVGVTSLVGAIYVGVMLPMIMNSHLRAYVPRQAAQLWDAFLRRLNWIGVGPVAQQADEPKNS
jgi:O-antigen/teichoic acid export membrane protein